MQVRRPRLVAGLALVLMSGLVILPTGSQPATADPITLVQKLLANPGGHAIYLVQDLGGGAYWVPTTGIHNEDQTGSEILLNGDQTVADLIGVLQANGRDLLLLINGAILQPVKDAIGG